jgi:hypothetical protein
MRATSRHAVYLTMRRLHTGFQGAGVMRQIYAMAFAGVAVLAAMPSLHAATQFCDSFKSKTDPTWGDEDGAWAITKRTYYATAPSNTPLTYTDLVSYQALRNFTLSVTVNDIYDGGIWLRSNWNGAANGVLLVVGGAYSNYTGMYWHIVTNGVVSAPKNLATISGFRGSTAKIKVVVKGKTYAAYVNGSASPATTLTDTTYRTGSAGLYDNSAAPQEVFSKFCLAGH